MQRVYSRRSNTESAGIFPWDCDSACLVEGGAGRIKDDKADFRVANNFLSLPIKSKITHWSNRS